MNHWTTANGLSFQRAIPLRFFEDREKNPVGRQPVAAALNAIQDAPLPELWHSQWIVTQPSRQFPSPPMPREMSCSAPFGGGVFRISNGKGEFSNR